MTTCPRCFRPASIPSQRFCSACGSDLALPKVAAHPKAAPIISSKPRSSKLALLLFLLLVTLFLCITLARW